MLNFPKYLFGWLRKGNGNQGSDIIILHD